MWLVAQAPGRLREPERAQAPVRAWPPALEYYEPFLEEQARLAVAAQSFAVMAQEQEPDSALSLALMQIAHE